jgi:hypothetical protein
MATIKRRDARSAAKGGDCARERGHHCAVMGIIIINRWHQWHCSMASLSLINVINRIAHHCGPHILGNERVVCISRSPDPVAPCRVHLGAGSRSLARRRPFLGSSKATVRFSWRRYSSGCSGSIGLCRPFPPHLTVDGVFSGQLRRRRNGWR